MRVCKRISMRAQSALYDDAGFAADKEDAVSSGCNPFDRFCPSIVPRYGTVLSAYALSLGNSLALFLKLLADACQEILLLDNILPPLHGHQGAVLYYIHNGSSRQIVFLGYIL